MQSAQRTPDETYQWDRASWPTDTPTDADCIHLEKEIRLVTSEVVRACDYDYGPDASH